MKKLRSTVVAYRPLERLEETGPAGAALEFRTRLEQRVVTGHAEKRARTLLVQQGTCPRPLGAVLAQHVVLLGRQLLPPLFFGLDDFECLA